MKAKKCFIAILSCILILTSLPVTVTAEDELTVVEAPMVSEYVENEIIITTTDEIADSSKALFTENTDEYTLIDFESEEITSAKKLQTYTDENEEKTYVLEVEGDVQAKCEELEKLPGVVSAEPNVLLHTMGFTMPAEVSGPAKLYSEHQKWYFDLMNIPSAWETFETTGEGVLIAVIDNGFYINATEFPTNLWTDENGNHGWNTAKNSADISPIYKNTGEAFNSSLHGTHVAGIIGAQNDGKNIIGAAYDSELMLINAAHYINEDLEPAFAVEDIIEAIDYARINGADIINLSLGAFNVSQALEDAVNRAYDEGVAVIAATGNNATSAEVAQAIPASYENVIGVMASDKDNPTQLAYFSNYDPTGKYYDVAAPGTQILSCTIETGKVSYVSGTSQAAPLVSSAAALYLEEYPNATVEELYEAIRESPTTFYKSNSTTVPDATYTFKRLDALQMLEYGKVDPETVVNSGTSVIVDKSLMYIYGLDEGFTDISAYITVKEGTGVTEFVPTENGNGTGSVLNIYTIYGDLYKSYTIIIFGDLNGDSYADGQDSVLVSSLLSSPSLYSEAQEFAADVDYDSTVSEYDRDIIAGYAIGLDYVMQIK